VNGSGRRVFLLLAPVLWASIALPAQVGAAEAARLSPSEVAEGLQTIQVIAGDVVTAGANQAKAEMIAEGIEPIWTRIEDTIKANDQGSYTTFEKGIEGLEAAARAGDADKAGGSAGVLASAVKFYVAKFPANAAADRKAAAGPTPAESKAAVPEARGADAAAPEAGDAALARTGDGSSTLIALAGAALGLGGLAIASGARRRPSPLG
jgi:hypothetical protein